MPRTLAILTSCRDRRTPASVTSAERSQEASHRSGAYLVVVVVTVEEGLLPEDHAGQHAAQAPHVQTVVIHLHTHQNRALDSITEPSAVMEDAGPPGAVYLVVHQQLGSFEVAGRHPHVVLLPRVVKLRQAPVDEPQLQPQEAAG